MLFSKGSTGNDDIVMVIVAAFVVESTLETTHVAVSTLSKEEIAAVQAEFDKRVPSASNVTSWPTNLRTHNPPNEPLPTFVVMVKTKSVPGVNGSSPLGHNWCVQS